ncbi:periplasmic heavy metal sensor [Loktanella agnita]|uniref:periplasmic heavy metal sensor n=1 Tax=Loktanella agnita TaxID=287097 RepID=UPI0039858ECC
MDDLGKPARGTSRLTRVVLVISLALNLAVVGLVAGAAISGRFGDGPPRNYDFGLGPIARALEPDERRAIGAAMRRDDSLRGMNMRARMRDTLAALRAEPFDRVAVQALIEEQNARMGQLQRAAQAALLDQIAEMDPARRAAFADQLEAAQSRDRPPRTR